ncbi:hypothetical protein ACSBR1_020929 [Camellia fascicularis]
MLLPIESCIQQLPYHRTLVQGLGAMILSADVLINRDAILEVLVLIRQALKHWLITGHHLHFSQRKRMKGLSSRQVTAVIASFEGSPWKYCYKSSSGDMPKTSSMAFKFSVNNNFTIHDPVFIIHDN